MELTRPRTEVEKDLKSGGFKDIRYWKENDYYQKAIVEIDDAYNRWTHGKRIPFSRTMALDFLNVKMKEIEKRIKKAKDLKQTDVKIDLTVDWDKFGGMHLFDFIKEGDAMTTMIISGIKQPTKTGVYRDYKCKETGCGVTLFLNNDELEKEVKSNAGNSNKKELPKTQNPLA